MIQSDIIGLQHIFNRHDIIAKRSTHHPCQIIAHHLKKWIGRMFSDANSLLQIFHCFIINTCVEIGTAKKITADYHIGRHNEKCLQNHEGLFFLQCVYTSSLTYLFSWYYHITIIYVFKHSVDTSVYKCSFLHTIKRFHTLSE